MATQENVRDVASLNDRYRTLISAAILAPSGDNLQPWKFEIDEANQSIAVIVDDTRDTSPMNAGQRMSRIACGACAENIVQTAEFNHWATTIEFVGSTRIEISLNGDLSQRADIPREIRERHTNRIVYQEKAIDSTQRSAIEEAIEVPDGIEMQIVTDRGSLSQCAEVIGQADAMMFGQRQSFSAFLENVRFDQTADAIVSEGLSIGSLELDWVERMLLPRIGRQPETVWKSSLVRSAICRMAKGLVESASGLCVITAKQNTCVADLEIGRTMQRTWLALTKLEYAVQPMMSVPVLLGDRYVSKQKSPNSSTVRDSFEQEVSDTNFGHGADLLRPCAILRFGHAPRVRARTGRIRHGVIDQL